MKRQRWSRKPLKWPILLLLHWIVGVWALSLSKFMVTFAIFKMSHKQPNCCLDQNSWLLGVSSSIEFLTIFSQTCSRFIKKRKTANSTESFHFTDKSTPATMTTTTTTTLKTHKKTTFQWLYKAKRRNSIQYIIHTEMSGHY